MRSRQPGHRLLLAVFLACMPPSCAAIAGDAPRPSEAPPAEWKLPALGAIRAYQLFLSSQDAPSCPFHPSCSRFGRQAIRRHGVQGLLMTSDRVLRCNGIGLERYPLDPRTGKRDDPTLSNVLLQGRGRSADSGTMSRLGLTAADESRDGSSGSFRRSSLSGSSQQSGSEDREGPFHPGRIREFADHLFSDGDYLRAAGEYQRYLVMLPSGESDRSPARRDSVILRVGLCYQLGGDAHLAARHYRGLLDPAAGSQLRCLALPALITSYWDQGLPRAAVAEINSLENEAADLHRACSGRLLRGSSHLLDGAWAEARADMAWEPVGPDNPWSPVLPDLRRIAEDGIASPRKSAVFAGLMSAVVPGSGRIYAGRTGDGILSLLTVLLTGWQAAGGFMDDGSRSTRGWIYGAVCMGFHTGNVYGSAQAAQIYNREVDNRLKYRSSEVLRQLRQ